MQMRRMTLVAAIGLVVALSACGNGAPTPSGGGGGGAVVGKASASGLGTPATSVSATAGLTFDPTTNNLKTGAVLQWTNTGSVPHNVTFDDHSDLTSPTMQQNDTWQVKFTAPGTYAYHCTFHPGMNGSITVGG